jgi:hypothetical protein
MKNVIVGQLVELLYKAESKNAWWEYGVVEYIYDDRVQIARKGIKPYMHILVSTDNENKMVSNQPVNSNVTFLFKNGKPVMAKKKLFGGYKFTPCC